MTHQDTQKLLMKNKVINKITGEIFDVEEVEDNRNGNIFYKRLIDGRIYLPEQIQSLELFRIQAAIDALKVAAEYGLSASDIGDDKREQDALVQYSVDVADKLMLKLLAKLTKKG